MLTLHIIHTPLECGQYAIYSNTPTHPHSHPIFTSNAERIYAIYSNRPTHFHWKRFRSKFHFERGVIYAICSNKPTHSHSKRFRSKFHCPRGKNTCIYSNKPIHSHSDPNLPCIVINRHIPIAKRYLILEGPPGDNTPTPSHSDPDCTSNAKRICHI